MIGFSDIAENGAGTENLDMHTNIKLSDRMNYQEDDAFWKAEFQKAHEEAETDLYDRLLSEVFNRSEDEISIDFNITDDIKSALEKINNSDWDTMNTESQLSALKEFVSAIGKELGMKNLPNVVVSPDCDDAYGKYDPESNTIKLNKDYLSNAAEFVDTVTHELRHAYQHERAEICETHEDALFKVNFDNYISPVSLPAGGCIFFMDYYNQYIEVDARAFANIFTEAMK